MVAETSITVGRAVVQLRLPMPLRSTYLALARVLHCVATIWNGGTFRQKIRITFIEL